MRTRAGVVGVGEDGKTPLIRDDSTLDPAHRIDPQPKHDQNPTGPDRRLDAIHRMRNIG